MYNPDCSLICQPWLEYTQFTYTWDLEWLPFSRVMQAFRTCRLVWVFLYFLVLRPTFVIIPGSVPSIHLVFHLPLYPLIWWCPDSGHIPAMVSVLPGSQPGHLIPLSLVKSDYFASFISILPFKFWWCDNTLARCYRHPLAGQWYTQTTLFVSIGQVNQTTVYLH